MESSSYTIDWAGATHSSWQSGSSIGVIVKSCTKPAALCGRYRNATDDAEGITRVAAEGAGIYHDHLSLCVVSEIPAHYHKIMSDTPVGSMTHLH